MDIAMEKNTKRTSLKLIPIVCSACGANVEIQESQKTAFCSYCGAKLLLHNDNEYILRNIDEASVIRAETERIIALKKLEIEEAERLKQGESLSQILANRKKKNRIRNWIGLVGFLLSFGGAIFFDGDDKQSVAFGVTVTGGFMILYWIWASFWHIIKSSFSFIFKKIKR